MHYIRKEQAIYAMDKNTAPVATVKSGEVVTFETYDCFTNQIHSEKQAVSKLDWNQINPATGPLYVKEAKAGDVLEVLIEKIEIGDTVTLMTGPELGVLGDDLTEITIKQAKIKDNKIQFTDNMGIPLNKMIGVIGTAPAGEAISCGIPDAHGGNMDTKDIAEGAMLYLPVNVDGALLAIGDCHAAMGDGEVSVCGGEVPAEVTVRVRVLKNCPIPTPFLIREGNISTIASKPTLDEAAVNATKNMVKAVLEYTSLKMDEAAHLLSLAGNLKISQIVDPNKTARMELPLCYLSTLNMEKWV
ncbi:acetamidase/formamidase family protein [Solibacillus silvestris]|uniref:acetamidase/formamidase family protein n=1 Tax=Solibacillus silvestris TaxID=76853 RepID=UPI003F7E1C42